MVPITQSHTPNPQGWDEATVASTRKLNECTQQSDCDPDPEEDCYWRSPEDCSVCVLSEVLRDDGTAYLRGRCVCTPAQRCTKCTLWTHYRTNGVCIECPKNMWMLFLGIFLVVVCMVSIAYQMKKHKVHMGYLTIGIDYFQILAIFAASKTRWPLEIRIVRADPLLADVPFPHRTHIVPTLVL